MVGREILKSRIFRILVALSAILSIALAVTLIVGPGERQRLRQRVQKLEKEKKVAVLSSARWEAESKAKDQFLIAVTSLLNEVGSRIDDIQANQQGLVSLSVQGGDSWRVVKNKSIPEALDRIAEQLKANQEQIGRLEALTNAKEAQNQAMKAVVERLKHQNEGLDQQLQALRRKFGGLSRKVKNLEGQVVKLEGVIDDKDKTIGEKNEEIVVKETALTEKSQRLEVAEAEKWLRHYVVGTRKELCALSIVTPCGFIKAMMAPRLADRHVDAFEKCGERCQSIDARSAQELPVGKGKGKVEVLPPRPANSFAVQKRGGEFYLLIRDRDEFWKVYYLAVVVER